MLDCAPCGAYLMIMMCLLGSTSVWNEGIGGWSGEESNWESGRGTTKRVESLNNRRAKLKLCMFDRVRPIVLYCHRLQRIEKRIVVQTVHLVRVILQSKGRMFSFIADEEYTVVNESLHLLASCCRRCKYWSPARLAPAACSHSGVGRAQCRWCPLCSRCRRQ